MPPQPPPANRQDTKQARWELLQHIHALTDKPMIALSLLWLGLLILDYTTGYDGLLQRISYAIWILFVLDFAIEIILAPDKADYLRRHWLTPISLLLPALRVFRLVQGLRLLRVTRAARPLSLLRLLTSVNRTMGALATIVSRRGLGYVIALTLIVTFGGAAGMIRLESPAALREAGYLEAAARGDGLQSYGEAVWWTAMIMTTMGPEYWPKTVEGRILCWLLALYAFAIFGYITASIASYFIGRDRAAARPRAAEGADMAVLREEIAALRGQVAALQASLDPQAVAHPHMQRPERPYAP